MFKLRTLKTASEIEIRDVMSNFYLRLSLQKHAWQDIEEFIDQLKNISIRDTFELNIELDGADHTINSATANDIDGLRKHYEDHSEEDEGLDIYIKIDKKQNNNIISIYNLNEFRRYLTSGSILKTIEILSTGFHENQEIIFEVFDEIENFGSNTIKFIKHEKEKEIKQTKIAPYRRKTLELFKENTTLTNLPYTFIAEDFNVADSQNLYDFESFFNRAKLIYSLACLSNSTEVSTDDKIRFKFNGYKSFLTDYLKPEKIPEDCDIAYKIYAWTFSDGHCSDKLGLVRNIVTLNNLGNRLNLNKTTWHTIQSNYEIYLKENISQYLELKGKLLELISEFNKRAFDATDNFIGSFQSSATAFVTFIISVVAINGLKDSGADKIFSKEYFLISAFICSASIFWLIISRADAKERIRYITSQTKKSIMDNYKNILSTNELSESIEPEIKSIKKHTDSRIKKYTILWILSIFTFFIVFTIGYSLSEPKNIDSEKTKYEKHQDADKPSHPKILNNFNKDNLIKI